MIKLFLTGIVGFDITANAIRESLSKATENEDVVLEVSSPGGSVAEGFAIYNLLKNYKGKITSILSGFVGSAATYLILPSDEIVAEDNAVFMIHNASAFAGGDYRVMEKTANILRGLNDVIARGYSKKTKKPLAEVKNLMDEETFFFGKEIVKAGFADRSVLAGKGAENKSEAIATAQTEYFSVQEKAKELFGKENISELAALAQTFSLESEELTPNQIVDRNNNKPRSEKSKMDLNQFKAEHPELHTEVVASGVKLEHDRVNKLRNWIKQDPKNQLLIDVVAKAEAEGKTVDDVYPELILAIRDGKAFAGENPPAVPTIPTVDPLLAGQVPGEGAQPTPAVLPRELTAEEKILCGKLKIKPESLLAAQAKREGATA